MRKIMFNDKYGLTEAVLSKRKTQTRRIVSERLWEEWTDYDDYCSSVALGDIPYTRQYWSEEKFFIDNAPYKVGEVLAIAQNYKDAGVDNIPEEDEEFGCYNFPAEQTHGWNNKMFVRADLMPHQIRITNVRVERLNDISVEDCEEEGIYFDEDPMNPQCLIWTFPNAPQWYFNPHEAYAVLIDKISGKGSWESNPYVFVYDFEIVEKK